MFEPIFALIIVIAIIVVLALELYDTVVVFFIGLMALVVTGILNIEEALQGFTNPGLLTRAALFIIVGVIKKSRTIFNMATRLLGETTSADSGKAQLRVMLPVTLLSAFINNIPIVALFISLVRNWAVEHNLSPSKFLIPLSYASIFGGLLTLIGTSTNLIVSGMLQEAGGQGLGMFEIAKVGLPLAAVGTLYMVKVGHKLLPEKEDLLESLKKNQREYLVKVSVEQSSDIAGRSVKAAGLRSLQGLYLIEIVRGDKVISPVNPEDIIQAGDKLIFTGQVDTIVQLQAIEGMKLLTSADDYTELYKNGEARIVEAVVSSNFPFLNQTIKESNFRSHYNAAVVAVIRQGERINEK